MTLEEQFPELKAKIVKYICKCGSESFKIKELYGDFDFTCTRCGNIISW